MAQSQAELPAGLHVGMIMDGNGRWAMARGQPRVFGHRAGARTVNRIVEVAPQLGIGVLTLYAFSADNWKRPPREVAGLMRLFRSYLAAETARCVQNGVRIAIMGRRDRLPGVLTEAILAAEAATVGGRKLLLRIALDYSARDSIVAAAARAAQTGVSPDSREAFSALMNGVVNSPAVPDVDLLIRTGGEQRLSDFLLWECAYAELKFESCKWPDFDAARLDGALREYRSRDRRFGGLSKAAG